MAREEEEGFRWSRHRRLRSINITLASGSVVGRKAIRFHPLVVVFSMERLVRGETGPGYARKEGRKRERSSLCANRNLATDAIIKADTREGLEGGKERRVCSPDA